MEDERSEDDFKFDLSKACLKYIKIANLTAEHPLSAPNFVRKFFVIWPTSVTPRHN